MDVDTFLTELYVMVDDYCKTTAGHSSGTPGPMPSLSRSEVVTLALFSQWGRFSSERDFYRYAQRHLRPLFPSLPDRSQFNRLMRSAVTSLMGFNRSLVSRLREPQEIYEALDTMGCRTRNLKRRGNGWLAGEVDVGWCNRLGWYEGFNLITSVTPSGVISGFGIAPASTKEQPFAETFLAARACQHPALPEVGAPLLGWYLADNGFCGAARHQQWASLYDAHLISPPQRRKAARPWPKPLRRWLASLRQIVETVHDKLLNTFGLERERPHDRQGFRARLAATVGLHNFCIWLNDQLGRDRLAFADLIHW